MQTYATSFLSNEGAPTHTSMQSVQSLSVDGLYVCILERGFRKRTELSCNTSLGENQAMNLYFSKGRWMGMFGIYG